MRERNTVSFALTGIDMNSVAESPVKVAPQPEVKLKYEFTERGLIEHIMKRSLYAIFQRMSTMANRNPDGLIDDLKTLRKDGTNKGLVDYCSMWTNHLCVEMDTEGLFEQDAKVMRAICKEK